MAQQSKTRAEARLMVLALIEGMADSKPTVFVIDGAISGRIQSSTPNFTEVERAAHDHLPEGSS